MKNYWYSAKCVFRILATDARQQMYEERIVLIKAPDWDSALEKAETEAKDYTADSPESEFTGFVDLFQIYDEILDDKAEVFSSMRTSDLNSTEYLNRFLPERPNNCEDQGQAHRWYTKSAESRGCYHCNIVSIENVGSR